WTLSLELKNGDQLKAKAVDMVSRKNVEYLTVDLSGETRELRLDHIASFSHPELGTVIVSEDE
ncbi:Rho-binding antiterminator, partial [Serratia sp. Se-PFBMAAmG]|nr:Rho-binding antiterminator [Serratia sp. Se-PFBMAAmG]